MNNTPTKASLSPYDTEKKKEMTMSPIVVDTNSESENVREDTPLCHRMKRRRKEEIIIPSQIVVHVDSESDDDFENVKKSRNVLCHRTK